MAISFHGFNGRGLAILWSPFSPGPCTDALIVFQHVTSRNSRWTPWFWQIRRDYLKFQKQAARKRVGSCRVFLRWLRKEDICLRSSPSKKNYWLRSSPARLSAVKTWIVAGVKAKDSLPQDSLLGPALEAFFGDLIDNNEEKWEVFRQQDDFFVVILGLLDGLLAAWLPQRPQNRTPTAFQIGSDPAKKLLIMCPKKDEYLVVIPALLTHDDYDFLNRIWIVTTASDEYDEHAWKVIGKSTSFGAIDFVRTCQFGDLRPGQGIKSTRPESRIRRNLPSFIQDAYQIVCTKLDKSPMKNSLICTPCPLANIYKLAMSLIVVLTVIPATRTDKRERGIR